MNMTSNKKSWNCFGRDCESPKDDNSSILMNDTSLISIVTSSPGRTDEEDAVETLLTNWRQRLKEFRPGRYVHYHRTTLEQRQRKVTTPVMIPKRKVKGKMTTSLDGGKRATTKRARTIEEENSDKSVDSEDSLEDDGRSTSFYSRSPLKFISFEEWRRTLQFNISAGNDDLLKRNLQGFDFNKEDPYTLLHLAVDSNKVNCVDILLSCGADVDAVDDLKRSPMHYAVINNNTKIMEKLLEEGANINLIDVDDMTPVMHACIRGLTSCLELLIPKSDLLKYNSKNRSVLHYAAVYKDRRCLDMLLHRFGLEDIDAKDDQRETPLHLAALAKREANVECLLKAGADPMVTSKDMLTPAHYSAFLWDTNSVRHFLTTGGVQVNVQDGRGRTLLHHTAMKNTANEGCNRSQTDCLQYLLLYKKIEVDKWDDNKTTALGYAIQHDSNLARFLILAGANVNGGEKKSEESIHNEEFVPPLHHAARANQVDGILLLLENKARINVRDKNKSTALHVAIEEEHVRAAVVLLQNKADTGIRDGSGKNALEIALDKVNPVLATAIIQHSAYTVGTNVYEINIGALLPAKEKKPETELLYRVCETFKEEYKKNIFLLPATRAFLNLKIKCLSKLEIIWVLITILFLGLGFNFLFQDANCLFKYHNGGENGSTSSVPSVCYDWNSTVVTSWLLWFLVVPFYLISEIMECKSGVKSYFTNLENYLDIFLILSCLFLCPWSILPVQTHKVLVIISMIACGLDFMLALGTMTSLWKVQMMMFRNVLKKAVLLLIPFVPLLLCFSFAVHTVLQDQSEHKNVFHSFIVSVGYMVGNIDSAFEIDDPIEKKIALGFLIVSFVLLIIIVMMNLLTGLAVNITDNFRTHALYKATVRRLATTYHKEQMILTFNMLSCEKFSVKEKLENRGRIKVYNSKAKSFKWISSPWDRLFLNLGELNRKASWPMKWIGLNKRDVNNIDRTRRKAQSSRVGRRSFRTSVSEDELDSSSIITETSMTNCDLEVIEMQLAHLFQKMVQLETLLVNRQK